MSRPDHGIDSLLGRDLAGVSYIIDEMVEAAHGTIKEQSPTQSDTVPVFYVHTSKQTFPSDRLELVVNSSGSRDEYWFCIAKPEDGGWVYGTVEAAKEAMKREFEPQFGGVLVRVSLCLCITLLTMCKRRA